jgi:hypothetical protein
LKYFILADVEFSRRRISPPLKYFIFADGESSLRNNSPPAYEDLIHSEYVILFIKPEYEIFDYLDFFKLAQTMTVPKIEILAQELKKGIELKTKMNYSL